MSPRHVILPRRFLPVGSVARAWRPAEEVGVCELTRKPVALVSGFSSDIGKACARQLLQDGFQVVASSRSSRSDSGFETGFLGMPGLSHFQADLGGLEDVGSVRHHIQQIYGQLDTYVHVAGGAKSRGPFADLTIEDWRDAYEENVLTFVALVSELLPIMRKGENSCVIVVGSATAFEPGEWNPHYSSAKAALHSLCKHLSNVVASDGIRVNSIALGPISGDESQQDHFVSPDRMATVLRRVPLQRLGTSRDVSGMVSFLASRRAAWITGARFQLDGGKARSV